MNSNILTRIEDIENNKSIKVSATEPQTGEKVWFRKGKNLFNKDTIILNYMLSENGTLVSFGYGATSDFIKIVPKCSYFKTATGSSRFKFFDANKQALRADTLIDVENASNAISFISPENAYYVRFSIANDNLSTFLNTIQLEQNTVATTYEQYVEDAIFVKNNNGQYEEFKKSLENTKIDKNTITISMQNQKWYRVARLCKSGVGLSAILSISTTYNNRDNSSFVIALNVTNNNAKITQISTLENAEDVIKTVRIVKDNNVIYLEVFYNLNVFNSVAIEILNQVEKIEMLNVDTTDTTTVLSSLELYSKVIEKVNIFTAKAGFAIVNQNMYNQENHYWGYLVVKKESGSFSNVQDLVAQSSVKNLNCIINNGCFLGNNEWNTTNVGYCYYNNTDLYIADHKNTVCNYAKMYLDFVL